MFSLNGDGSCIVKPPVTIKCPIWGRPVTRYSFTWDATQKWREGKDKEAPITSPPFRFGSKDELEACLVIHPYGEPPRTNEIFRISVFLQITSRYNPLIRGNLKLFLPLIGTASETIISTKTLKPGLGWGFHNIVDRGNFTYYSNTHSNSKIECTLSIVERGQATADVCAASDDGGLKEELKVSYGYKKLCMSDLHSDVTIVVGESHLKAHKNILSTQSPVFEAMLSSNLEEANCNVINIVDMDVDLVKEMLRYIYSGSVDDLQGSAEGLLMAADKYCLPGLKSMCENALCKTLTVDNVSRVLRFSDLHNSEQLKAKSVDFMGKNLKDVRQTDGWKMLKETSSELIFECLLENVDWELRNTKV